MCLGLGNLSRYIRRLSFKYSGSDLDLTVHVGTYCIKPVVYSIHTNQLTVCCLGSLGSCPQQT